MTQIFSIKSTLREITYNSAIYIEIAFFLVVSCTVGLSSGFKKEVVACHHVITFFETPGETNGA